MMKKIENFNVISFESTHMAIKSEKLVLEDETLKVRIIPVPREITASCGLALKVELDSYDKVREILESNKVEVSGCYIVKKEGFKKEIVDISK